MSGMDIVHVAEIVAKAQVAPVRTMLADGMVATVEGDKAAIRIGGPTAEPVGGFTFPPSLDVQPGDHVLVYRLGGYQMVLAVLNRNAVLGAGAVAGGTDLALAFFLS